MKNKKELPFVSIVLIAYNEEKGIGFSLISLLNQSYPKNKYEIIVVDDHSKDKTIEIVKRFPVKLIQHQKNLGRAQARNTGLKNANGEIYVSFDGDCIAEKNWLKELIKVYQTKKDVLGVGGKIILPPSRSLTDKFIQERGYGNPIPFYMVKKSNILSRFLSYLKFELTSKDKEESIFIVGEIMGANSSFYKNYLKKIRGWDLNLNAKEDTDICYRLKNEFPDKEIYATNKAKITHNHHLYFFRYLKSQFFRGDDLIKLYKKQNKTLPIFPFPLLITTISLFSLSFGFIPFVFSLLLVPQIFYFWNIIKFFNKFDFSFLIFPYMQFLLELSGLLGILRGYFIIKKQNETPNKKTK